MIKKSLPVTVEKVLKDGSGNWIIISIKYESRIINISNIYGPNEDSPQFFEDLFNNINGHGLGSCIITGDFNTTLNFTLDNENYAAAQNNQARATLNQLISDFEYFDTYRELEGEKRDYTWFKRGGAQKGRLDMFLASNSLKPNITASRIVPTLKSDHHPILLNIDFTKFIKGKGYWKFDSALLNDTEYISRVKKSIKETCAKYMVHDSYTNFFQDCTDNEMLNFLETHTPSSLQNLDFNINPNLFLEMLLNDIKNVTISYSVQKNREINLEEKTLFENLKRAKNDVMENDSDTSRHNLADIENKYDAFMDKKAKDFILNRNTEMKIQGEKPNSFFCSLEKNSASQKYIPKLDISEGRGEKNIYN